MEEPSLVIAAPSRFFCFFRKSSHTFTGILTPSRGSQWGWDLTLRHPTLRHPTLLSSNHLLTTLALCLGSLPRWLKILCRLLDVFFENLDVLFLSQDAIHFVQFAKPSSETQPQHDAPACKLHTVRTVFFGLKDLAFLHRTNKTSLWTNSSIFLSSHHRTDDYKLGFSLRCLPAKASRVARWRFVSKGVYLGCHPWRPCAVCAGSSDLKPPCSSCQAFPGEPL